ncbi:hypothetical protein [Oryzibacter oryziterrae]|uniref:hypothetical protein n=1 Tax=Oryzibacter oryziterrae TaxID=2766474 RepID=UPI001F251A2C|nr:hypothetical protein [Oryzibacter oryziterrae]
MIFDKVTGLPVTHVRVPFGTLADDFERFMEAKRRADDEAAMQLAERNRRMQLDNESNPLSQMNPF